MQPHAVINKLLNNIQADWQPLIKQSLACMDVNYLETLLNNQNWLPGFNKMFAAFNLPVKSTRYILLGESPYPRPQSANGYAFWDDAVSTLWSPTGLSKEVNRATSLRNLMKMLLLARGDLQHDFSQEAIARLDKSVYWQTASEFFNGLIDKGFLLLNASLVYRDKEVNVHARQWRPFLNCLLDQLAEKPDVKLILFGRIASMVNHIERFSCLISEHPYNISFITNPNVLTFFKPLDLLRTHEYKINHRPARSCQV